MVKTDKRMPSQLPLDPKLPANFDDTPNSERSKEQLDEWWDHPYGITKPDGSFTDRCLNGGARDRSSVLEGKNLRRGLCPGSRRPGKMGQNPSETYLHVL